MVSKLDEIRNIAKIMDDFPNLRALGNNAESLAEKLLKASDGDTQILSRLNSLPDKAIETFAKDFSQADDILAKFAKEPTLVESWKVLSDAGVPQILRGDIENLTKVNRYLDNNPTKKDVFIDDLKSTADPQKFINRTSWKDDLAQQYGLDFDDFDPQGISKADIPEELYNDMLRGYSNALSPELKERFLNQLIESGSDIPTKVSLERGDELFKIVPKGDELTQSPFYVNKSELESLKIAGNLEQRLGIPLGSHAVEYDIYRAVAKESVEIFESTVAPTLQRGFKAIGGARQSFILDVSKWNITKVETILPN